MQISVPTYAKLSKLNHVRTNTRVKQRIYTTRAGTRRTHCADGAGPRAELVSTKPHPQERLGAASSTISGEATTIQIGLQETDVSVYNAVPRTSYGCYRRAEVLETHVRITCDRSAYRPSPVVRSQLKQRLHNSNRVGAVICLPG